MSGTVQPTWSPSPCLLCCSQPLDVRMPCEACPEPAALPRLIVVAARGCLLRGSEPLAAPLWFSEGAEPAALPRLPWGAS